MDAKLKEILTKAKEKQKQQNKQHLDRIRRNFKLAEKLKAESIPYHIYSSMPESLYISLGEKNENTNRQLNQIRKIFGKSLCLKYKTVENHEKQTISVTLGVKEQDGIIITYIDQLKPGSKCYIEESNSPNYTLVCST